MRKHEDCVAAVAPVETDSVNDESCDRRYFLSSGRSTDGDFPGWPVLKPLHVLSCRTYRKIGWTKTEDCLIGH